MYTFCHIVEHYPPGTIYNLISPLTKYKNHKVFLLKNENYMSELLYKISKIEDKIIILHSTGRKLPVFSRIDKMSLNSKIYIYMHVSYEYLKYRNRDDSIDKIKLLNKKGIIILTPSQNVAQQYIDNGIDAIAIRPGIRKPFANSSCDLSKYYGKIITTCSESSLDYFKIKGVDNLYNIIKKNKLNDLFLVVGNDLPMIKGINTVKLTHDDLLDVLYHSIVYVQLSRYESYNITAVEAKQLKVPIILLGTEGHYESAGNGIIVKDVNEAERELTKILENGINKSIINDNYIESIKKESLESFHNSFSKLEDL